MKLNFVAKIAKISKVVYIFVMTNLFILMRNLMGNADATECSCLFK